MILVYLIQVHYLQYFVQIIYLRILFLNLLEKGAKNAQNAIFGPFFGVIGVQKKPTKFFGISQNKNALYKFIHLNSYVGSIQQFGLDKPKFLKFCTDTSKYMNQSQLKHSLSQNFCTEGV